MGCHFLLQGIFLTGSEPSYQSCPLSLTQITGREGSGTPLQDSCLKIPRMEEPGRLWSMGSLGVGPYWATSLSLFTFMHWRRKEQPTPVFLPGESQGRGEPGRLLSMGSHKDGHNWSNLAATAADYRNHGKDNSLKAKKSHKFVYITKLWVKCKGLQSLRPRRNECLITELPKSHTKASGGLNIIYNPVLMFISVDLMTWI